jgi:hypothetical protein
MKYWWLDLPYRLHVFLFTLFISPFVAFWHFFLNNFFNERLGRLFGFKKLSKYNEFVIFDKHW